MSKLAVVFPGIGYTVDKPLLHYSRRLAADAGYEIKLLPYAGFPKKVKGDKGRMADSYRIALEQSKEMLSETDFSVYEEILFIGKSIGTIVAAQLASESPVSSRIRLVLYTPLKETFSFPFGEALVFTGSADPWVQRPCDSRRKSFPGDRGCAAGYPEHAGDHGEDRTLHPGGSSRKPAAGEAG